MDVQTNNTTDQNMPQVEAPANTVINPAATPQQPIVDQSTTQPVSEKHTNKKLLFGFGIVFFIIVMLSLIAYGVGSFNRAKKIVTPSPVIKQQPTATPMVEKSQEEIEAESVSVDDPTTELNELENEASML